jgi:CHAT domain-containing protein
MMKIFILALAIAYSPQHAFEQGRFSQAIKLWEKSLPTLPTSQQINVLIQLATAYKSLGLADNSFTALHQALSKVQQTGDKIRHALILGSLSDLYLLTRELDKAEKYAQQSVKLVCRHPIRSPLACATALNFQANILSTHSKKAALAKYKKSLFLAKQDPVFSAKLLTNIVQIDFKRDNFDAALSQMQALPDSHDKIFGLLKLGYLAIEHTDMKYVAYETLQAALQLAKKLSDKRAASYAKGYLGKLYEKYGRYAKAERLTREAIFLSRQDFAPDMSYLWQWQWGRLRYAQNDLQGAIAAYQQAVKHLQSIRRAMLRGYRSPPLTAESVYFELADLWLQSARRATNEVQRREALLKARDTLELLKAVELENYFMDECVTALQAKNQAIDKILTDTHTAVLYPMIFSDRVELLLSFPGSRLKLLTVTHPQATQANLTKIIKAFQRQLRKPNSNYRRLLLNARTLYDIFIKKSVTELQAQEIKTLIIVPDRLLRTIPFAALHNGKQFLIEQYALAISPGLTLTEPQILKRDNINMMMCGLSKSVQGFSALPNALKTFQAIENKNICPKISYISLKNQEFRKNRLKEHLENSPYQIVHFATHGKFEREATSSFLLTYEERLNLNELERLISISRFRDKPVELLILSACETAVGDELAALGLAGVAIKAGARSALASLWLVDEDSTAQLMSAFYSEFCNKPYLSKAQALAQAQKRLLFDRRYKHPYYWAPFLLIGNWK